MIDSGSQGNLIEEGYARSLRLPLVKRAVPIPIEAFDGRPSDTSLSYYTAPVQLQIGQHTELIELNVAAVAHYPLLLGVSWIRTHDPTVHSRENRVAFNSAFCAENSGIVPRLQAAAASLRQKPPATATSDNLDELKKQIPGKFHDYLDVFSKASADSLPEHRPYDLKINLEPGKTVPPSRIYPLSAKELEVLADYIETNLKTGFIRPSTSPIGAPILFIKKKDGTLRLCVDFRNLNSVTIKNRHPLPLIDETLDQLSGAKFFTKLDLRNGYHQLRIAEGDEYKTAFRTRYGLFEYQVMPFGLTNAPAAFQNLLNDTFRPFLDSFVIVYLDDILVYSRTQEEHDRHVRQVLETMRTAKLYAKAEKCSFEEGSTEYLGFIVDVDGVRMDPKKIETVQSWPLPTNIREVQSFLGFCNFYRRFIRNYSTIAAPLTRLTRRDRTSADFPLQEKEIAAFQTLRDAFHGGQIIRHFQPGLPIELETDASDYALGSVLSQRHADGKLYPIAFRSRKFDHAELNYEVHDKEFLAIVDACRVFRPYLEYVSVPTKVFTDHANLKYFFTSRVLNRRQARWYETVSELSLTLHHRPGHRQGKTDALSRRADYADGAKASEGKPVTFFPAARIAATSLALAAQLDSPFPDFAELVAVAQDQDDDLRQILQDRRLGENAEDHDARWQLDEQGLLRFNGKVYLPDVADIRLRAVRSAHDETSAGHLGVEKTLERFRRTMTFPHERKFIESFVGTCDVCFRNKSRRSPAHGLLQPLPPPTRPWSSIATDFIVKLPTSRQGHDSIWVVVDRFTKFAHFVPCNEAGTDASKLTEMYFKTIFPVHGLPDDIVSDRGTIFNSNFWRTLNRLTRTKLSMSTAYHPQSDGITERLNQSLEQYLRIFVNYAQDDWEELLPLAAFVHNDTIHSSTKSTPFFANYGFHPRFTVTFKDFGTKPLDPDAASRASALAALHQTLRHELDLAATRMKTQYDKKRVDAPKFNPGDLVWLSHKNILTNRSSQKLDHRFLGPYPVKERVGDLAYRLDLPAEVRLHPVFHVSLLHPHAANPFPDRLPAPPPLTIVDGQPEEEVEAILDSQTYRGKLRYLIKWRGKIQTDWLDAQDLDHAQELVHAFHEAYPNKPKAPAVRQSGRRRK
ncbi:hypothetical protein JCM1840_003369 [Sporobolomyces johnsonii]